MIMKKRELLVKKARRKMRNIDNVNDHDYEEAGVDSEKDN